MKKLILALCIISAPAFGGTRLDPPKHFDHAYSGTMVVMKVKRSSVYDLCLHVGGPNMRRDVEGCAYMDESNRCVTVVSMNPVRARSYNALLRHERAHCNGWKH